MLRILSLAISGLVLISAFSPLGAKAEGGPNPSQQPRAVFLIHGIKGGPESFGDLPEILTERLNKGTPVDEACGGAQPSQDCGVKYCKENPTSCRTHVVALQYDTYAKQLYAAGVSEPEPFYFAIQVEDQMRDFYKERQLDPATDPFSVIVHSQGGLVTLAYLDRCIKNVEKEAQKDQSSEAVEPGFAASCESGYSNSRIEAADVKTLCEAVVDKKLLKNQLKVLMSAAKVGKLDREELRLLLEAIQEKPYSLPPPDLTATDSEASLKALPASERLTVILDGLLGKVSSCGMDAPKKMLQMITLASPFWGSPVASGVNASYPLIDKAVDELAKIQSFKDVEDKVTAFLPQEQLTSMAYGSPSVVQNRNNLFLTAVEKDGITQEADPSTGKPAFRGIIPSSVDVYNFGGVLQKKDYPLLSDMEKLGIEVDFAVSISAARLDFHTYWEYQDPKTGNPVSDSEGRFIGVGTTRIANDHFIVVPDSHMNLPDIDKSYLKAQAPECISRFRLGRQGTQVDKNLLASPQRREAGDDYYESQTTFALIERILLGEHLTDSEITHYLNSLQNDSSVRAAMGRTESMVDSVRNFASEITISLPRGFDRKIKLSRDNFKIQEVPISATQINSSTGRENQVEPSQDKNIMSMYVEDQLPLHSELHSLISQLPLVAGLLDYNSFNPDAGSFDPNHNYETYHHEGLFSEDCAFKPLVEPHVSERCKTALQYQIVVPGWETKEFSVEVSPSYTSYSFVHLIPHRPIPPALRWSSELISKTPTYQFKKTLTDKNEDGSTNPRWGAKKGLPDGDVYILNRQSTASTSQYTQWLNYLVKPKTHIQWIEDPRGKAIFHDEWYGDDTSYEPRGFDGNTVCNRGQVADVGPNSGRNQGFLFASFNDDKARADGLIFKNRMKPGTLLTVLGRFSNGTKDRYLVISALSGETPAWINVDDVDIISDNIACSITGL